MGFTALCLLGLMASALGELERDEEGIHRTYAGYATWPWSRPHLVQTVGYPDPSPHDVEQIWRYLPATNESAALKVICYDFRLPQGGPCLVMKDEEETQMCGTRSPFTFISKTRDIQMTLKIRNEKGVYLNCTVEAIFLDEHQQEVTTTTTTTEKPVELTYLKDVTEEIDSDEHGGAPGYKMTGCPCGWANKVVSRIVNGTEASPNEFPFAAGLVERESRWQFCGAIIITSWHALTATHCTIKSVKAGVPLSIVVGEHNRNDDPDSGHSQVIDIQTVIEHEAYDGSRYINDISLLVLKTQIRFNARIGPACLPTKQLNLENEYVKIIGWGAQYFMGPGMAVLRKVNVRVVNRQQCHRVYSQVSATDPTHLCTYALKKASCQGDSGGPVVWLDPETNRYTLAGIVSFGRICGDKSPSVHTDVGAYLDWIKHFISVSKPTARMCFKRE